MCNCVEPPKGKQPVPPTPDNAAEYREAFGEMVLVQYTYKFAPESATTFKGPGTNANYGQRAKNDIFYIWQADLDAGGEMFTKVEYFDPAPAPTVVPPEPPLLIDDLAGHDDFAEPVIEPPAAFIPAEMPPGIRERIAASGEVNDWNKSAPKKSTPPRGTVKKKATRKRTS